MKVEFVTPEQAEEMDVLVCVPWTTPPLLPDNQRGTCAMCQGRVQLRPYAPKRPMRVCVDCAPGVIRPQ